MLLLQIVSAPVTGSVVAAADTLSKAATSTVAAVPAAAPAEDSFSLLSMIGNGGLMMYPLALLLVASIYVLFERLIIIIKASKKNESLLASLQGLIKQGNISAARSFCIGQNSPEGMMLEKGVSRIGQPVNEIREAMNEAASVQLGNLEKHLNILNITGRIAPMFGFIGTIIGVVKIFYNISLVGTVEISTISTGLYEKMISSASGLVVGVFAFVAYHWMNSMIDTLARRMEETKMRFFDMLNEPS
ncbi:MAG: MotA/TolQ/ExbB proton channel family protein [Bacteroidia bacterium]